MALRSELRKASLSEIAQRESLFFRRQMDILHKVQSLSSRGSLTSSVAERALTAELEHSRLTLTLVNAPKAESLQEAPYPDLRAAIEALGWTQVLDSAILAWYHGIALEGARAAELKANVWTQQAWATHRVGLQLCKDPRSAMFLNIGIAGMAAWHGKAYRSLYESLAGGTTSLAEAERRMFGHDHADLGGSMLEASGFDSQVAQAAAEHCMPHSEMAILEAVAAQLGLDGGLAAVPPAWENLPGSHLLCEKVLLKISETLIAGSSYLASLSAN